MKSEIFRTIDANANRMTEGLRVCEDISRFVLADRAKTQKFKSLRHDALSAVKTISRNKDILTWAREPGKDIGKRTTKSEAARINVADIFEANVKRAEEAARVLEEFSKLTSAGASGRFKKIRFELYSLEKNIAGRLQALRGHRQGLGQRQKHRKDR